MKHLLWIFCFIGLLINCSNENVDNNKPNVAVTPATETTNKTAVRLKANNVGNVQLMDFTVTLDTTEDINLLQYDGPAVVTVHSATFTPGRFPCLASPISFKCPANLSNNNINIENCNVGGYNLYLRIFLLYGEQAKAPYSIIGVEALAPPIACR